MNTKKQLNLGDLHIDTETQEVYRKGHHIKLRRKEYELLEFLAHNKDRVLNRLTILEYVWSYEANVKSNTLEVHMAGLRKKLDRSYPTKFIQTIHGRGYRLCDQPAARAPSNTQGLRLIGDQDPAHNPLRS